MRTFIIAMLIGIVTSCSAASSSTTSTTITTATTTATTTPVVVTMANTTSTTTVREAVPTATIAVPTTTASTSTTVVAPTTTVAAATTLDTWAFCGVHPDDVHATAAVHVLAVDAGITATFGPCMPASSGYSPANTGTRYVDAAMYMRVVLLNASVGMSTVVYDARLWSDDASVRSTALAFWAPVMSNIVAFDMGDEFDPKGADWAILIHRTNIMNTFITPVTGVMAYTNHLPFAEVLNQAIVDLGTSFLSFDSYDLPTAEMLTLAYAPKVDQLMVAIDALVFSADVPVSASIITSTMKTLATDGADSFLIFGGGYPYNADLSPAAAFGGYSLIDANGNATPWANAVLVGSQI